MKLNVVLLLMFKLQVQWAKEKGKCLCVYVWVDFPSSAGYSPPSVSRYSFYLFSILKLDPIIILCWLKKSEDVMLSVYRTFDSWDDEDFFYWHIFRGKSNFHAAVRNGRIFLWIKKFIELLLTFEINYFLLNINQLLRYFAYIAVENSFNYQLSSVNNSASSPLYKIVFDVENFACHLIIILYNVSHELNFVDITSTEMG